MFVISDTIHVTVEKASEVHDWEQNFTSMVIFPNPASENISISFSNRDFSNNCISVFNSLGDEIKRIDEKELIGQRSINVSTKEFPAGVYFCKLNIGINKITKSFMVIR